MHRRRRKKHDRLNTLCRAVAATFEGPNKKSQAGLIVSLASTQHAQLDLLEFISTRPRPFATFVTSVLTWIDQHKQCQTSHLDDHCCSVYFNASKPPTIATPTIPATTGTPSADLSTTSISPCVSGWTQELDATYRWLNDRQKAAARTAKRLSAKQLANQSPTQSPDEAAKQPTKQSARNQCTSGESIGVKKARKYNGGTPPPNTTKHKDVLSSPVSATVCPPTNTATAAPTSTPSATTPVAGVIAHVYASSHTALRDGRPGEKQNVEKQCLFCERTALSSSSDPASSRRVIAQWSHSVSWLDIQARPWFIVTPTRHVRRWSQLSQDEVVELFQHVAAVIDKFQRGKFASVVITHHFGLDKSSSGEEHDGDSHDIQARREETDGHLQVRIQSSLRDFHRAREAVCVTDTLWLMPVHQHSRDRPALPPVERAYGCPMDVVLDIETGDPDDFICLLWLGTHPLVNLKAVTITPGSPDQVALVRWGLEQLQLDIPVGSLNIDHPKDCVSAWHYKLCGPLPPSRDAREGWKVLVDCCDAKTTLVTGASLKNLANALKEPTFQLGAWVAQGGFAGVGVVPDHLIMSKFANKTMMPTYNFSEWRSATAALSADRSRIGTKHLVSKNVCHRVVYDRRMHRRLTDSLQRFQGTSTRQGVGLRLIHKAMDLYLGKRPGGKKMHDPLAAAAALDRGICTFAEVAMRYERKGWGAWGCSLAPGSGVFISIDYDHARFVECFLQTNCEGIVPQNVDT